MGRAAHLLTDTVTIALETSRSGAGDPTFGAQSTLPARVEHRTTLVIDDNGNEARAGHKIVTESEIDRRARIWLPGDDPALDREARRIITVARASTPDGYTLFETFL